jgi:large repetitive protein
MALAVEAGVIKPFYLSNPWLAVLATEDAIQAVKSVPGVKYIAMDSPLTDGANPDITSPPLTVSDIDDRVASYIKDVESYQPDVQVGDIEPYPYLTSDKLDGTDVGEIKTYVDGLISRGATPAFFHLDINYNDLPPTATFQQDLLELQSYFAGDNAGNENIPFGILFDEPGMVASDQDYSTKTLQNIDKVKSAMGVPQQAVFDSNDARDQFGNQYLPTNVPETQPYTSTWLVNQGIQDLLLAGGVSLSGGMATFSTSALAGGGTAGTHTITALYSPDSDANFAGSESSDEDPPQNALQVVNPTSSSVSVSWTPGTSVFGHQTATFTASVSAESTGPPGYPTGTVTFTDGSTALASVPLTSGQATFTSQTTFTSQAIFTTSLLSHGTHIISANYSGDENFRNSDSASLHAVVNITSSKTTISSSLDSSALDQTVTFTATVSPVSPSTGTPTGTVNFIDGSGSSAITLASDVTLDTSGQATFTSSTLALGTHTITASYVSDDGNFTDSNGDDSSDPYMVVQDATTVSLASDVNHAAFGQVVNFTATISAPGTPTGTVTFTEGSTTLTTGVAVTSGKAIFPTSSLSAGTHTITATYSGDSNFGGSSGDDSSSPQVVTQAGSSITVSSSVSPASETSVVGQTVTFTATVVSAESGGAGTPTGTVTFQEGLNHNSTLAGSVAMTSGHATFTTSTLALGPHTITASYLGDGNFGGISGDDSGSPQVVSHASSTVAVSSSANSSVWGQVVTFTATVSAVSPGAIWPNAGVPTGTVTFKEGSTTLVENPIAPIPTFTTSTLSPGILTITVNYQATFTTSKLSVGTHTITASYSGDSNFVGSDDDATPFGQTVNPDTTSVVIAASPASVVTGQAVSFIATITNTSATGQTPTGSVQFTIDGSNFGSLRSLSGSSNTATAVSVSTTFTASSGTHTITAQYVNADVDFSSADGSTSLKAGQDTTSTTDVTSSVDPSVYGQTVTFSVTVQAAAPGAGVPTGAVTFSDQVGTLGSGTLNGSGLATFTTSTLSTSVHTVTASYDGDSNFRLSNDSESATPLVQTVQAHTTTSIKSSAQPAGNQGLVLFTVTVAPVSPGSGTPTGTVTFLDGSSTIATASLSGGKTIFHLLYPGIGVHTLKASYAGDTNFAGSSGVFQETIQVGTDTYLSVPASTVYGQVTTFTATVRSLGQLGYLFIPPGAVTFWDTFNGTVKKLGVRNLVANTNAGFSTATFSTGLLPFGSHTITAVFGSPGNTGAVYVSSASLPEQLTVQGITTTTLTPSTYNPTANEIVTFTATVIPRPVTAGAPTGRVRFMDDSTTTIGSAELTTGLTDSTATYAPALSKGKHNITAEYVDAGDSQFINSPVSNSIAEQSWPTPAPPSSSRGQMS